MSRVGQRALVTGAASGIGHLAVQIAKSRGAKHFLLAEIRAEQTVDSSQQEFDDVERAIDVVLDLAGAQTPLGAMPPCVTVAGDRGDLRMWTLPARRPATPVSYMLIEPTAPGWKPSPNSPTAAGCVCTSPSPWLLAQTARAHDLAAGQAKPSSSSGSTERLPGDFIDAPLPQLRAEAGREAGQPVTGGTQRGTMQGHRRNDHGEAP